VDLVSLTHLTRATHPAHATHLAYGIGLSHPKTSIFGAIQAPRGR
jgi:hypothetical protein